MLEQLADLWNFVRKFFHLGERELLHDGIRSKPDTDFTLVIVLEECAVVDDTSAVEAFQDEFFAFVFGVDLNDASLKHEQSISAITRALENMVFFVSTCFQAENNLIQVLVFEGGEKWDSLKTLLDEPGLRVVIVEDVFLQILLEIWQVMQDLLIRLLCQLCQRAVLDGNDLGRSLAAEYE